MLVSLHFLRLGTAGFSMSGKKGGDIEAWTEECSRCDGTKN